MITVTKNDNLARQGPRSRRSIKSHNMGSIGTSRRQHPNAKHDKSADDVNEQNEEVEESSNQKNPFPVKCINSECLHHKIHYDGKCCYKPKCSLFHFFYKSESEHPRDSYKAKSGRPHYHNDSKTACFLLCYNPKCIIYRCLNSGITAQFKIPKQIGLYRKNAAQHHIWKTILPMVIVAVVAIAWNLIDSSHNNNFQDISNGTESELEEKLRSDIKNIQRKFPLQSKKIWTEFSAGIKKVEGDPNRPSVFLLLHNTEEETSGCLAHKIGNISTYFLNAIEKYPLTVDGIDLEYNETLVEDFGRFIEENRPEVEQRRAMIVKNLQKIPGIVAQAFHSFCDTYQPLVDKAVFLFTMKIRGAYNGDNPSKIAESELRRLWNKHLSEDVLHPLVVRITDTVMFIKPENDLTSCDKF